MKKMRKGKKMLIMLLVAVLVVVAVILIVKLVNRNIEEPETPEEETIIIPLPETTYSEMQVINVHMEYLKDNNETVVSMEIDNTTENLVESEFLDVVWIGPDDNILAQKTTWIQRLAPGEQYKIQVVEDGDLTTTTQIKLIEK